MLFAIRLNNSTKNIDFCCSMKCFKLYKAIISHYRLGSNIHSSCEADKIICKNYSLNSL